MHLCRHLVLQYDKYRVANGQTHTRMQAQSFNFDKSCDICVYDIELVRKRNATHTFSTTTD